MSIRQVALGAAGATLALGLFMSNDVRAVAAALVNVTNTSANPVPTRSTDILNNFSTRVFPSYSNPGRIVVPAGKYLVITSVRGFNNGGIASSLEMDATANGAVSASRFPFRAGIRNMWYLDDVSTQTIAEPGSTIYFFLDTSSTDFAGFNIDVAGYYVPVN